MTTPSGFVRCPEVEQTLENRTTLASGQVMALVPTPPSFAAYEAALKHAHEIYVNGSDDLPEAVRIVCHCACTCALKHPELEVSIDGLLRLAKDPSVSFNFRFSGLPSLVYVGVPALQAAKHKHETSQKWIECFKLVAGRVPLGKDLKETIPQLMAYAAENYDDFGVSSGKTEDAMANVLIDRVIEVCGGNTDIAFKLIGATSKP